VGKLTVRFAKLCDQTVANYERLRVEVAALDRKMNELLRMHEPAPDDRPESIVLTQEMLAKESLASLRDLADALKLKLNAEEKISPTLLRMRIERFAVKHGKLLKSPQSPVPVQKKGKRKK
jgi:hypothetical protein